jgi:hypothetical protein
VQAGCAGRKRELENSERPMDVVVRISEMASSKSVSPSPRLALTAPIWL